MSSKRRTRNPGCFEELRIGGAPDRSQTRSQCMNAIPAEASGLPHEAYTPPPWEVFYEFARLVCVGFKVTFGPRRACVGEDRRPKVEARQKSHDLPNQCQTPTLASMIEFQPVVRNSP
jgi:hypothetical protein